MKVEKICFSEDPTGHTDRPLYGDNRGNYRSHSKEVVVHTGMDNFRRRLVAGVAVTATHASYILTINRDKKYEIFLAVSSKNRK